ncbi:MAG: hypothetical protein Q4C78_04290 [Synergistaceae bacterium]|nr:hypothetical protein [Synergistaceae bacterium]
MDSRRRRLLRQKYLQEEERLGKMSRGLSYDDADNFDENEESENSRSAARLPKYKARTFKNILRDFDDPDFDESQYFGQNYHREELRREEQKRQEEQGIQEEQEAYQEPEKFVKPESPTSHATPTEIREEKEIISEPQGYQDQDKPQKPEDELEETNHESDENDYLDDLDLDINIPNTVDEDDSETLDLPPDYKPLPLRRHKTLRYIDAETRQKQAEKNEKLQRIKASANQYNGLQEHKSPAIVRHLAFLAFIMLAFLAGYYLCGGVLHLTNFQPSSNQPQVEQQSDNVSVPGQNNVTQPVNPSDTTTTSPNNSAVKTYTIFVPKSGSLTPVNIEQKIASSNEQMLKGVLNLYLDSVKEVGLLSISTSLTEVWIAGNTLYLSMNQNFLSDLRRLNASNATILMRGFLRTVNTNMSSIKRLKVFVDSQEITDTKPIDLTSTWETM